MQLIQKRLACILDKALILGFELDNCKTHSNSKRARAMVVSASQCRNHIGSFLTNIVNEPFITEPFAHRYSSCNVIILARENVCFKHI